jgi:hypothetical protein
VTTRLDAAARRRRPRRHLAAAALGVAVVIVGCGGDSSTPTAEPTGATASSEGGELFPDVLGAVATLDPATATWSFEVTISSPYDTPERYADGWRVVGPDGTVYGEHTLAHDHAGEQPFTRVQRGVAIPDGVDAVTIEGRDQQSGFGGRTITVPLTAETP